MSKNKGLLGTDLDSDSTTRVSWCYIANSVLTLGVSAAAIGLLFFYHKQDSDHIDTLTTRVTTQELLINALKANLTALTS